MVNSESLTLFYDQTHLMRSLNIDLILCDIQAIHMNTVFSQHIIKKFIYKFSKLFSFMKIFSN